MARCFLTGTEIHIDNAYVLNKPVAYRRISALKAEMESLRRLLEQLGPIDKVVNQKNRTNFRRRLICPSVANALAVSAPGLDLFQTWGDYRTYRWVYLLNCMKHENDYRGVIGELGPRKISRIAKHAHEIIGMLRKTRGYRDCHVNLILGVVSPTLIDLDAKDVVDEILNGTLSAEVFSSAGISPSTRQHLDNALKQLRSP